MRNGKTARSTGQQYRGSKKELARVDYWHKLSESERAWLNQFNSEFITGRFSKNKASLHCGSLRKDCYNRNNRINRDATHKFKKSDFELE